MAACPAGHDSAATDYCDVCGMRMEMPGKAAPGGQDEPGGQMTGAQATAAHVTAATPPGQSGQLCPRCGAVRSGRFCEGCGLDLDAPMPPASAMAAMPAVSPAAPPAEPPAVTGPEPGVSTGGAAAYGAPGEQPPAPDPAVPAGWSVAATADRDYYDTVAGSGGPDAALVTFPPVLPRAAVRADQPGDADRPPQRLPRAHPGDRPNRASAGPGHLAPARGPDGRPGDGLVRDRPGLGERDDRQRQRDPDRGAGAVARRRPHSPGRLDADHRQPRELRPGLS